MRLVCVYSLLSPKIYKAERSSSLQSFAKVSSLGNFFVVIYCVIISGDTPIFSAISFLDILQFFNSSLNRSFMISYIAIISLVFKKIITDS